MTTSPARATEDPHDRLRAGRDLLTGAWRTRACQVRGDPIEAPNWWPIEGFVAAVSVSEVND